MKAILISILLFLSIWLSAQNPIIISGSLIDSTTSTPITGAHINVKHTYLGVYTNQIGEFTLKGIKDFPATLVITHISFETLEVVIDEAGRQLPINLSTKAILSNEVIVTATRANQNIPTTFSEVSAEALAKQNLGQDIPTLLEQEPSMIMTSDAGAGVGYSSLRLRGSDQSRINVTINGIPYNDPESQGVYWVDLPDFASSVDNIQIQRGVGTSTNGAGAFGGTVNIQTTGTKEKPYGEVDVSYGSFNTLKTTARLGTGLIKSKFSIDGRLSRIHSDGFVDRADVDLFSFFLSAGFRGEKSLVQINAFSGKEKTYQAWWGVAEDILDTNRTYNYYNYDNQTDNYKQDHYQFIYSQQLAENWILNSALYYTRGKGYYEEYKGPEYNNDDGWNSKQSFADYGFENVIIGTDTITETSLIRRRWLDNHFYGANLSAVYTKKSWDFTIGGGWNQFLNDHYGEVIWAEYSSTIEPGERYYFNDATKNDGNVYAKLSKTFFSKLTGFVDLQVRNVMYKVEGIDNDLIPVSIDQNLTFFNPKLGLSYSINNKNKLYASFAIGSREPTRGDYLDAKTGIIPSPEYLRNFELGYQLKLRKVIFNANYYLMYYKDQLVLTGELNDVGSPIKVNVDKSYRTGVELQSNWQIVKWLNWSANVTYSVNRIIEFNEQTPIDWGWSGFQQTNYKSSPISYSPNFIGGSTITVLPCKGFEAAFISKFVSKQYLDNTGNDDRSLDPYFVNNIRLSYTLSGKLFKEIVFKILVNNVFNHEYESNGYTFGSIDGESGVRDDYNYYYPQAGINVLGGVTFKF